MKTTLVALATVLGLSAVAPQAMAARLNNCSALFTPERLFEDTSGARLVYEAHGPADSNTVVVFFNGIDRDLNQWNIVRQRVEAEVSDAQYVQIDLLGQGKSSALNRRRGYTIPYKEQIRLIKALIEKKGWDQKRLILVGHSYGGGIAASYVRDVPGTVSDAILIDPFADNLEVHQPGVGPMMAMMKNTAEMMGFGGVYDQSVLMGSAMGMTMTWGPYSVVNGAKNSLSDVLAMTYGNRSLGMTDAMRKSGTTKMHLMPSAFSEMVPATAHMALWTAVPEKNRGDLVVLPSSHDSVFLLPNLVSKELIRVLKRGT